MCNTTSENRFINKPGRTHWKVVKQVLRYLRGTSNTALGFLGMKVQLQGYVDSNLSRDKVSRPKTHTQKSGCNICGSTRVRSWSMILSFPCGRGFLLNLFAAYIFFHFFYPINYPLLPNICSKKYNHTKHPLLSSAIENIIMHTKLRSEK